MKLGGEYGLSHQRQSQRPWKNTGIKNMCYSFRINVNLLTNQNPNIYHRIRGERESSIFNVLNLYIIIYVIQWTVNKEMNHKKKIKHTCMWWRLFMFTVAKNHNILYMWIIIWWVYQNFVRLINGESLSHFFHFFFFILTRITAFHICWRTYK